MDNHLKRISKLVSSLNIIGITDFFQLRINKNNQFFILSNNTAITHYLHERRSLGDLFSGLGRRSTYGKISAAIWTKSTEDAFLNEIYKLGIENGISIGLPTKDYIDIFSFASTLKDKKATNLYLNYLYLLKRFIIFFRIKAKRVIEQANQNLLTLIESIKLYSLPNENEIVAIHAIRQQLLPIKSFINTTYSKKIVLTEKETHYLSLLLEGKSMQAIAKENCVSPRSVESCFEIVKTKTGYRTKSELLSAFIESQFYQLNLYYDRYS